MRQCFVLSETIVLDWFLVATEQLEYYFEKPKSKEPNNSYHRLNLAELCQNGISYG